MSISDRFWEKVDRSGDGCWEWQGSLRTNGYGQFLIRQGKVVSAHRVAYTLTYGPIPPGLVVCHHCDNPRCVRPDHLFLGTQSDNMQDMVAKGRNRSCGLAHLLTEEQREEVCRRYSPRKMGAPRLAEEYGVSPSVILNLVRSRGLGERHLTQEQREEVRRLYACKVSIRTLASLYGVSRGGIEYVLRGRKKHERRKAA